ncbi:MAG: TolC family protein [Planctomycetales bacterium]|nr:TolC family protein [Planctomycetales bacterium]
MTVKTHAFLVLSLLSMAGCASTPKDRTVSNAQPQAAPAESAVVQASHLADDAAPLALPAEAPIEQPAEIISTPNEAPTQEGLTLEMVEAMAMANNPAIAEAAARARALRGKWLQAGLPPNPTAGYSASEVGNDGAGGQQGGYIGQDFITAGKLHKDRAVVAAEVTRAEQLLVATQRRVQTDVRGAYYSALVAQRRVQLAEGLLHVTSEAASASQALVEAEELPLAGLLQTEVQQQNAKVFLQTAKNAQAQAWRILAAVVGGPELPVQDLEGDVTRLPDVLDWQTQLDRLQSESPEIAAAIAEVTRARRALHRATVEAVPDISTQFTVQYDNASDYTITSVQIGGPIPLWNFNQGGIHQAKADITRAERGVDRVAQSLSKRLAETFRRYADAHTTATNYEADVLPRSQRTLQLVRKGYEQGEVGYLDLLAAQQTYSQTNLAYLNALQDAWQSYVLIEGLLLSESLDTPSE